VKRVSDTVVSATANFFLNQLIIVPWGKKSIYFDGEKHDMPILCRPCNKLDLFEIYIEESKAKNHPMVGLTTFSSVLRTVSSVETKSVAGLDQTTAQYYYQTLEILKQAFQSKLPVASADEMVHDMMESARKAKASLRSHYNKSSDCLHSAHFATDLPLISDSDNKDEQFSCQGCLAFHIFCQSAYSRLPPDLASFLRIGESRFNSYLSHAMRSYIQREHVKIELNQLKEGEIFVLCDFKMKFLRSHFREGKSDFFAKSGFSWHGIAIYSKHESPTATRYAEDSGTVSRFFQLFFSFFIYLFIYLFCF